MKMTTWCERIGVVLAIVGAALCLWAGGRWMNDVVTEAVTNVGAVGIVLTVVGVLMTNFNSDWLFRD